VIHLFRFIDWVMILPEDLETAFWDELQAYEDSTKMPYITSVERIGIQKGLQQGLQQGAVLQLVKLLQLRFTAVPAEIQAQLQNLNVEQLGELLAVALSANSLEQFASQLPEPKTPAAVEAE
jgi:Domain of unknown function (DUF4351)